MSEPTKHVVHVEFDVEVTRYPHGTYQPDGYVLFSTEDWRSLMGDHAVTEAERAIARAIVELDAQLTSESWRDAQPGEHWMLEVDGWGDDPVECVALVGHRSAIYFAAVLTQVALHPLHYPYDAARIKSATRVTR